MQALESTELRRDEHFVKKLKNVRFNEQVEENMVNINLDSVGRRISAQMKRRGLKDQGLADLAGMGKTAVYNIRTGKTKDPSLVTMLSLSKALGVPLGYLIDMDVSGTEQEKNNQNQANFCDYTGLSADVAEDLHNVSRRGSCMNEDMHDVVCDSLGKWPPLPRYDVDFLDEFFAGSEFFSTVNWCLLSLAEEVTKLRETGQREIGVLDTGVWGAVHSVHRLVEDLCKRFSTRYLQGEGLHSKEIEEYQLQCDLEKNMWRLYGNDPQENK